MSLPIYLADDAGLFAGMGAFVLLIWALGIVLTIFWIWMLVDCLGSSMPTNEKLIWVVVMLIIPVIGSLLYFFMKRQPRSGGVSGGRLTHA